MFLAASLLLSPQNISNFTPCTERSVLRTTEYVFHAGETVFQLTSPTGDLYTMQAYSLQVDPTLTFAKLKDLGDRLKLPKGWSHKTVKLEQTLTLRVEGKATVIQDELQNTYQKHNSRESKENQSSFCSMSPTGWRF